MTLLADKANVRPALNKEEIYKLIDESDEYTIGALLKIYSFQEMDEQTSKSTTKENFMGFNGADAYILSDMSEFYNRKGYLSEKQISFVRRTIKKYWGQLSAGGFNPAPIKNSPQNNTKQLERIVKSATLTNNTIEIKFSYPKGDNRFYQCITAVKTLSGRRFDSKRKLWKAPLSLESVEKLIEWRFQIDSALREWHDKMINKPEATVDIEIPGLQMELYPFQKLGVSFIETRGGRALVGDEMGCGKTAQALAYLQLHPELRPAVIVCPASLKLNWEKEISMWMESESVHIITGKKIYPFFNSSIFIINYDILSAWFGKLQELKPSVVILDESHFIKNGQAKRTKATIALCKKTKHVIALSGTPIINRPIEFYNTIKIIEPALFPSQWAYAHKFCDPKHNGFGWDLGGACNTEELHKIITKHIMIRRLKSEVLKELPAKVRSVVPIEIDNREEYFTAKGNIIAWITKNMGKEAGKKASRAEVLVEFEKLKQLAIQGKMKAAVQWIEDFLESDQKLVIFTTHTETINILMDHFNKIAVRLDGSTPTTKRQDIVDKFQTDENIKLFIGNIKAAGVGITLTAASNTCFLELGWTPGEHDQAEDRVHRIGQEADSVNAWYLLANGTIENEIAELLDAKRKVLASVLDGKTVDSESILSELIKGVLEV